MAQLQPYLRFNDKKAREAIEFYKGIFGGSAEVMTIGESPMAKEMPADKQDNIMHAQFTSGSIKFLMADMMRDTAKIGDNVSIAIECDSEAHLNTCFDGLAKGGDIFMKPEKQFWGGIFAVVTDKYGIEWMLNFQTEPMKK